MLHSIKRGLGGARRWYNAGSDDFYARLGVQKGASQQEIKKAYKKIAMELHPDRNPDKAAADQFAKINEAYETVSDSEKRQMYDTYGKDYAQAGGMGGGMGGMGGMGFEDIFGGMGGGAGRKAQKKTADTRIKVPVTLEKIYTGGVEKVRYARNIQCPAGQAAKPCKVCNGSGTTIRTVQVGPGMIQQMQASCQACNGVGNVVTGQRCADCSCNGTYVKRTVETIEVPIEKSMDADEVMVAPDKADEAFGAIPGDLIIELEVKSSRMKRIGNDILVTQVISLQDVIGGCTLNLPHPSGQTLQAVIEPGSVTSPTATLNLKGQGMPLSGQTFGDYLVELHVTFPKMNEEEAKKVSEALGRPPKADKPTLGVETESVRPAKRLETLTPSDVEARKEKSQRQKERRKQRREQQHQQQGAQCQHQ
eukprot:TRINITY_DN3254_c2_g2_i1.p1 TRINITY_DN3254_c2_g2~~TRINITY_DN3254_c2_g2_i1.p1  ORF type:complete len:437 (+),score=121.28 TRINITY_DN3254_c2_g2_i1:49-1311(+)